MDLIVCLKLWSNTGGPTKNKTWERTVWNLYNVCFFIFLFSAKSFQIYWTTLFRAEYLLNLGILISYDFQVVFTVSFFVGNPVPQTLQPDGLSFKTLTISQISTAYGCEYMMIRKFEFVTSYQLLCSFSSGKIKSQGYFESLDWFPFINLDFGKLSSFSSTFSNVQIIETYRENHITFNSNQNTFQSILRQN